METNQVYINYRYPNVPTTQSFALTLSIIEEILSERLSSEYTRIWVQGSNAGRVRFCFTIFTNSGYRLEFQEISNFRNWRPDGNFEAEVANIERIISSLNIRRDLRIGYILN